MSELKLSEQFRLHFQQLRSACNDSPQSLVSFFREKPDIETHAKKVKQLADLIDSVSTFRKLHPQVEAEFIADWKHYLSNWKTQVEFVNVFPLLSLNLLDEADFEPPTFEHYKSNRNHISAHEAPDPAFDESFDPVQHDGGNAITQMVDLVSDQAMDRRTNAQDDNDDFIANTVLVGVEAIEHFENVIGIDIARVYDRWNRIPAVFVPQHVSDRHGLSDKGSLFGLLEDAIRAYLAGAPGASIAMSRAVLERLLRDHYLSTAPDERITLTEIIEQAGKTGQFPKSMRDAAWQLKNLADAVLHRAGQATARDEEKLIAAFGHLKHWIESAPDRRED